jgi:hypothetical protein
MRRQAPFLEISIILPENGPARVELVFADNAETEIGRKSLYLFERRRSVIISFRSRVKLFLRCDHGHEFHAHHPFLEIPLLEGIEPDGPGGKTGSRETRMGVDPDVKKCVPLFSRRVIDMKGVPLHPGHEEACTLQADIDNGPRKGTGQKIIAVFPADKNRDRDEIRIPPAFSGPAPHGCPPVPPPVRFAVNPLIIKMFIPICIILHQEDIFSLPGPVFRFEGAGPQPVHESVPAGRERLRGDKWKIRLKRFAK